MSNQVPKQPRPRDFGFVEMSAEPETATTSKPEGDKPDASKPNKARPREDRPRRDFGDGNDGSSSFS